MGIAIEAERLIEDLPEDCAQIVTPVHAQLVKATKQCAFPGAAASSFFLIHDASLIAISND